MSTIAVGTDTLFIRDSGGIQYSTDNLIWTPYRNARRQPRRHQLNQPPYREYMEYLRGQ
jgi:hypothetical protein